MLKKKSRLKEIKISGYKSLGTDIQPIFPAVRPFSSMMHLRKRIEERI